MPWPFITQLAGSFTLVFGQTLGVVGPNLAACRELREGKGQIVARVLFVGGAQKFAIIDPVGQRFCFLEVNYRFGHPLTYYQEVREYIEKEHADWLRALTPRHINASADYWPQKVLAVSSANAAMQNYVDIQEHQTTPNPALAVVQGQAAQLLRYDVPTYFVSRERLAAALQIELPDDLVFNAIPFPFDALVFMLPKGTIRHPTDGDGA